MRFQIKYRQRLKVIIYINKVLNMFSIGDVVVATKGIDLGEMVVTGLSSGGFYVRVQAGEATLTYPAKDVKKA
ncbi:hypothetical protein VIBHAR_06377 [Vibrio campbellii ATCC BAA-1116]|uniref:Uncharacterized protein n=4 Tax=Vibrio harveyi group TaxID=717610 RepID=A7N8N0_VIBC1|nr:hypothetical protein VIBHAR_06377 [Vibrio campbellii ATCC BAA-1116]